MSGSVIVAGARTPMGRLLGSLKGFSAAELGGIEGEPRLVYYDDYAFEDLLTSLIGFTAQFSGPDAAIRELQEPPVPK